MEQGGTESQAADVAAPSRFAISLTDLEESAHVPLADQVITIRSSEPGRAPGDDDLTREQSNAIIPGL